MNYALLRSHPDEVFRFIWENAQVFGIDRRYRIRVDAVRPSMRVGPNGLVVPEVVADYVQSLELTAAELARKGVVLPARLKPDTPLQVWGGGVLVFDQFGRAKLHQAKRLDDWQRQSERINYLAEQGLFDTKNGLGSRSRSRAVNASPQCTSPTRMPEKTGERHPQQGHGADVPGRLRRLLPDHLRLQHRSARRRAPRAPHLDRLRLHPLAQELPAPVPRTRKRHRTQDRRQARRPRHHSPPQRPPRRLRR